MSANSTDCCPSPAGRPTCRWAGSLPPNPPVLGLMGASLFILQRHPKPIIKLAGLFLLFLGYFIPDLLLYSKGTERQKAMQLELANTLDQMLISVEAGLASRGAMARAGENGKGPLAEELVRTLQDMQVGRSRRESYLALPSGPTSRSCAASSRPCPGGHLRHCHQPGTPDPGQGHAGEAPAARRGERP